MRLLIINPVVGDEFQAMVERSLKEQAFTSAELIIKNIKTGPSAIEGFADEVLAGPEVLRLIEQEERDFDGFFMNCFGDVAVDAARELTTKPILGAGEATFWLAAATGVPFSIITIGSNAKNKMTYRFRELGCSRFVSGNGIPEGVLDLNTSPESTAAHIIEAANQEREKYGAELIVLGCTGMIEVAKLVAKDLDCPIIEPTSAGIKLLESFVSLGISHAQNGKYTPTSL